MFFMTIEHFRILKMLLDDLGVNPRRALLKYNVGCCDFVPAHPAALARNAKILFQRVPGCNGIEELF